MSYISVLVSLNTLIYQALNIIGKCRYMESSCGDSGICVPPQFGKYNLISLWRC